MTYMYLFCIYKICLYFDARYICDNLFVDVPLAVVVDVVVKLPQKSEDDSQKHYCCTWKADELITVGA